MATSLCDAMKKLLAILASICRVTYWTCSLRPME